MKKYTKLLGIVLIFALVMSMGTMALAEDKDTITISVNNANPNEVYDPGQEQADQNPVHETYTAYKIFDVTKTSTATGTTDSTLSGDTPADPARTGYSYTIEKNSPWYSVVAALADTNGDKYFTLTALAGDSTKEVISLNTDKFSDTAATAKAIASALKAAIPSNATAQPFGGGSSVPSLETAPGYYLILASNSTNLILATTDIAITVNSNTPAAIASAMILCNLNLRVSIRVPPRSFFLLIYGLYMKKRHYYRQLI